MNAAKLYRITGLFLVVIAAISAVLVFLNLNKGLIFNDEAYYLFHFRNFKEILTVDSTNYFRIFQPFFTTDIFKFRIITYVLLNISTFLTFFFAAKFFRLTINPIMIGIIGIAFNYYTWSVMNVTLSQYIGNTVLVNFSLASLFIFKEKTRWPALLFSGFFLGLLLFNGIPHTIVIGAFVIYLTIIFWKQKLAILWFVLGIALGILFYFSLIQNFSEFLAKFEYIKYYQMFHRKQHPKMFFVKWFLKVGGLIMVPAALVVILAYKKLMSVFILDYIALALAAVGLVLFNWEFAAYLQYLLLAILLIRFVFSSERVQYKAAAVMLFLIPFGLSFGSGAFFEVRSGAYKIYYVLLLIVVILKLYRLPAWYLFMTFFILSFISLPKSFTVRGWKEYVVNEQDAPVIIDGHPLMLDKARSEDLKMLEPYLRNQPKVIYSSNHLMGYLYILHALPPIPYYFTLEKYIGFIIGKKGDHRDDYIYLESNDYPFSVTDLRPMNFVENPQAFHIVKTGRFTLYLPANFVQK